MYTISACFMAAFIGVWHPRQRAVGHWYTVACFVKLPQPASILLYNCKVFKLLIGSNIRACWRKWLKFSFDYDMCFEFFVWTQTECSCCIYPYLTVQNTSTTTARSKTVENIQYTQQHTSTKYKCNLRFEFYDKIRQHCKFNPHFSWY